jgi:MFS family permease
VPSPPPHRLWTAGFVLMWAGQFLISMNFYLLMTVMALYAMERFGTDEALAGVATSAFIVGAVLARLLTGKYMELLGRRRVLLAALAVFTAASIVGGLVNDGTLLVITRFLKGAAAAFTAPASLSIITTTFAEGPPATGRSRSTPPAVPAASRSGSSSAGS